MLLYIGPQCWARALIAAFFILALPLSQECFAQDATPTARKTLFPDFGRDLIAEEGFTLNVIAINDIWGNTRGGIKQDASILGNLNISLEIDTAKAGWWEGGQFLFHGIYVYGEQPMRAVGDFQFTSTIDSMETFEPYQAWYSHTLLDGRVNLLAGIHDFTTEMALVPYAFTLMNASFLTPPTITQLPQSFYPNTSLGARAKIQTSQDTYLFLGVYDGTPTNIGRMREVDLAVSRRQGLFTIGEFGWITPDDAPRHSKLAVGGWYSSATYLDPKKIERDSNFGAYMVGEHQLYGEEEDSNQGLGVFFQVGYADDERNFNSMYYGAGLSYRGLFDCRDEDVLAFGFNTAHTSTTQRRETPSTEVFERAFELNYRVKVTDYLAVTPDIQYVRNPGMNPAHKDALVLYARVELAL